MYLFVLSFYPEHIVLEKQQFWAVSRTPGGFRELRETCRIDLRALLSDFMVPSYDQKPF